ncbi:hypothetical protein L210DRAFT_2488542 [Boletus edulis BED1]|uniref:Uncharacterized protein n=1 Tax=Boletus edulis BED1 TaxID=1328754 RepID=A0AAD4G6S2_BOLED|nr:hypothetical protein L210DRAFT_2488542 [Boletus edulis BED1]
MTQQKYTRLYDFTKRLSIHHADGELKGILSLQFRGTSCQSTYRGAACFPSGCCNRRECVHPRAACQRR